MSRTANNLGLAVPISRGNWDSCHFTKNILMKDAWKVQIWTPNFMFASPPPLVGEMVVNLLNNSMKCEAQHRKPCLETPDPYVMGFIEGKFTKKYIFTRNCTQYTELSKKTCLPTLHLMGLGHFLKSPFLGLNKMSTVAQKHYVC